MIEIWTIHEVVTKNSQTGGLGGKKKVMKKKKGKMYTYHTTKIRQREMKVFELNYTYSQTKMNSAEEFPIPQD